VTLATQQEVLRASMALLGLTRDAFAHRFGIARRALDTYLLPSTSAEFRPLPEVARRYVDEVVWLYKSKALTYTRCVHILESPLLGDVLPMNTLIDPMLVRFTGQRTRKETRVEIVVDGVPRPLPFHLGVRNHSPDGFEWGYGGSGPSQLALAMCVELLGPTSAVKVYQHVKDRLVAPLQKDTWTLRGLEIMEVVESVDEE